MKGQHPNSRKNLLIKRRPKKRVEELLKPVSVSMDDHTKANLQELGSGSVSRGVQYLYTAYFQNNLIYPQALILEMQKAIAEGDDRWEKHLNYLLSDTKCTQNEPSSPMQQR